ncbi:hypothetical protein [Nonomuraea sp. NPDC001023]|uniref:hypothetical protein n=1 Tax=unclassified Nonomuraea TaxID=2593643 RepID=UPI00332A1596
MGGNGTYLTSRAVNSIVPVNSPPPRIYSATCSGLTASPNGDLIIVLPDAIIVLDGATSVELAPAAAAGMPARRLTVMA